MTTVETYYAWDVGMTLAEYSPSGADALTWQKSFIYLGERLLATESGAGTYQYHHPDRLGTRLITNSGGSIISEQVHLPYGTALSGESTNYGSPDNPSKKRFTSYERSDSTKLDHAVNRQYHSGLGRFTQVDPIGMSASSLSDPQTLNLYAYCGNDPINHTDPDGLFFKKLFSAFGKALRFLFKVIAVELAIAVLAAGSPGGVLILLGLAAVFGIAGWHNGKLGNFVRTLLLAGGANSKHGSFRTPPTFGRPGTGPISRFVAQDQLPSVPPSSAEIAGRIALEQAILHSIATDAQKALKNKKCRELIGKNASAIKTLRQQGNIVFVPNLKTSQGVLASGATDGKLLKLDQFDLTRDPTVGGKTLSVPGISTEQARAVVLLHELAHMSGALYGDHTVFGKRRISGPVEANQIIYQTCFGGKP
jgi:RHS repeat-associated protein